MQPPASCDDPEVLKLFEEIIYAAGRASVEITKTRNTNTNVGVRPAMALAMSIVHNRRTKSI